MVSYDERYHPVRDMFLSVFYPQFKEQMMRHYRIACDVRKIGMLKREFVSLFERLEQIRNGFLEGNQRRGLYHLFVQMEADLNVLAETIILDREMVLYECMRNYMEALNDY